MIHVISATCYRVGPNLANYAMCGERLGDYDTAAKTHVVGNYSTDQRIRDLVTCEECREATLRNRNGSPSSH